MSVEDNKQIARRALGALTAGDRDALQSLVASDAILHQCGFLEPIPVHSILSGEFPRRSSLGGREIELERMIAEGDMVALHWRTSGRFSEPESPAVDGKQVSFPSMSFLRFDGDRIAEIWNIQDVATMETQLRDT